MANAQDFAVKVANASNIELSLKSKNQLLEYISKNMDVLNDTNSVHNKVLNVYLSNMILPSTDAVAILLSVYFRLILNKNLSSPKCIVFDISPMQDPNDYFNSQYINDVINAVKQIQDAKIKLKLRICDGYNNDGEVVWFDPYLNDKNMSVMWPNRGHTVRNLETTINMCKMAKNMFADYVTA